MLTAIARVSYVFACDSDCTPRRLIHVPDYLLYPGEIVLAIVMVVAFVAYLMAPRGSEFGRRAGIVGVVAIGLCIAFLVAARLSPPRL